MQNDNLKLKIVFLLLGAALLIGGLFLFVGRKYRSEHFLDSFAKCLTERGMVMYGAYWCPHCQNEKKAFGDSWQYVNYVECTQEPQKCLEQKIDGYPTWIFPDGKRLVGEQGIEKLSQASGCRIPYGD